MSRSKVVTVLVDLEFDGNGQILGVPGHFPHEHPGVEILEAVVAQLDYWQGKTDEQLLEELKFRLERNRRNNPATNG